MPKGRGAEKSHYGHDLDRKSNPTIKCVNSEMRIQDSNENLLTVPVFAR